MAEGEGKQVPHDLSPRSLTVDL
jgi:hypothetical protein